MPSRLGNLLDMKTTSMEKIIYFQDYVVIDPKETPLKKNQLLTEEEYRAAREQYGENGFEADMGAEAIRKQWDGPFCLKGIAAVEDAKRAVDIGATATPGHSSLPPRDTAIGQVAKALVRLEKKPFPAEIKGVIIAVSAST